MASDSIKKTFGVAALLCVVCAVVVSSAAVILRPMQDANKILDLKTNILASAGLLKAGIDVETQFEQITTRIVDMETGRFSDAVDPAVYDQRKASKDPAQSIALSGDEDIAKIRRRANYATVYIVEGEQGWRKSFCRLKAMVSGQPCMALSLWNRISKPLPVLASTSMPKHQVWVAKLTTLTGKPAGSARKPITQAIWRSLY